jgi:hypothetical protein
MRAVAELGAVVGRARRDDKRGLVHLRGVGVRVVTLAEVLMMRSPILRHKR